jgi:hypothetical protein
MSTETGSSLQPDRSSAPCAANCTRFGRKPRLSPQQREQVVALRLAGEAEAAIARLLNVSYLVIRSH